MAADVRGHYVRARMTRLLVTFLVSSALAGVGVGAVAVYVLGDIDPKFRDSLGSAFELELVAAAGFTAVGTVLVAIALLFIHRRIANDRRAVAIAFAWGVTYPLVFRFAVSPLLGMFAPESLMASVMGWVYLIGFPLLISVPLTALSGGNAHGQASPSSSAR